MGIDLIYTRGGSTFEWRVSRSDGETFVAIAQHLPDAVAVVWDVPDMGTPVVINADALRKAVLELASFLDQHSDMLPRTYEHKVERIDGVENMHFGFSTGGMSGIRLPGDSEHVYVIHSGLNKCTLQKIGINNEGRGYIIETRDVRKVKKIETANMGMLSIRSRRAKSELRRALKDIVEFLDRTSGDTVEKVVT